MFTGNVVPSMRLATYAWWEAKVFCEHSGHQVPLGLQFLQMEQ